MTERKTPSVDKYAEIVVGEYTEKQDWKAIAQELAELLEKIDENLSAAWNSMSTWNSNLEELDSNIQKALAKFNKFKESAVSEE